MTRRNECADALGEAADLVVRSTRTWTDADSSTRREEYLVAAKHAREWLALLMEINARRTQ